MSSTVLETNDLLTKDVKDKASVKWAAEVEISIISAILVSGKLDGKRSKTPVQEQEMVAKLAEGIAGKMVELAEVARISADAENIFTVTWGGDLMQVALQMFRDPSWRQQYRARSEYCPAWKRRKNDIPLTTSA